MTRPAGRGWLLPWLALAALAVVRAGVVDERDPYWQARAGVENLAGAPLRRPDSWSWDPVDALFTQTSPAWNDTLGLAWRAVGLPGLFLVGLASMLTFTTLTLALARRVGARPLPALAGVLVVLLLALPMVSPRATLVAQSLWLAWVLLADRGVRSSATCPPALVAVAAGLAGLVVAWAGSWLHLSWLLLAPAAWLAVTILCLGAPAVDRARRVAVVVGAGAGLGAGVLAGPYGLDAWSVTRTVQAAADGSILEWLPPTADGLAPRWVPTAVAALALAVASVLLVLRRWRARATDDRVGLLGALSVLGAPAALGGLGGVRFVGVALLTLAPVAALLATRLAARVVARAGAAQPEGVFRHAVVRRWSAPRPWRVVLTAVLVLLSPLVLLAGATLARPPEAAALPLLPRGCRLVSDPGSAGPVLLLRPDVRVWVDTRADYWGRERNREALAVLTGADTSARAVTGATCALLSTSDLPTARLAAALDADPGWRPAGEVSGLRVWVRER
ncbi:hypothetical protein KMZ32_10540 [Phycicoccus sp. MAQZ13P-2]|uniref:hypothetical protein n=1 Tax=Phycicoccus mangrovi TaxID=2840470 RepID=UPI001C003E31|nr:hypothetical protein [Phycicoccus mangrovi]MBT9255912.1 hypothetical protein [Phycicoccus mangrovi]MBT9274506.1 hypothetical protein [Phycicoccus mangrovi]